MERATPRRPRCGANGLDERARAGVATGAPSGGLGIEAATDAAGQGMPLARRTWRRPTSQSYDRNTWRSATC